MAYDHSPGVNDWIQNRILPMIHFCQNWVHKKQRMIDNREIQSALQELDHQLQHIQQATTETVTDPQFLYQWLHHIIKAHKQCKHQIKILSPSVSKTALATLSSEKGKQSPEKLRVPIGEHRLPPLPYPYDALEPFIDEETMHLHHDEHHLSYVKGLNHAEKMLQRARDTKDYELIKHWEREAAFHGAGHYLHTLFWETMSPKGGEEPTGALRDQINLDFGSFDTFEEHFSAAAEKVEGSGWAILVWSPRPHRLEILQAEKHQQLSQWDVIPLLALDVWEHAYYLKYHNKRKDYIEAWWHVVHWPEVQKRYQVARQVGWHPY
jgi:superoxide dismutase, Fe-Mn family